MTMPTPEKIGRYADRLLDRAKAMIADPDNMETRRAYMQASFNSDWTAAAIVKLAGQEGSADRDRAPMRDEGAVLGGQND